MPPRGAWRKPFAISWPDTPSRTRCLCIADLVCSWACQGDIPARYHKQRIGTSRGNRHVPSRRNSTAATPVGNRRLCCRPAMPGTRSLSENTRRPPKGSSILRLRRGGCRKARGFQPRPSPAPPDTSRDRAPRNPWGPRFPRPQFPARGGWSGSIVMNPPYSGRNSSK